MLTLSGSPMWSVSAVLIVGQHVHFMKHWVVQHLGLFDTAIASHQSHGDWCAAALLYHVCEERKERKRKRIRLAAAVTN